MDNLPEKGKKHDREIRFSLMRISSPDYLSRMFSDYEVETTQEDRKKLSELRRVRNQTTHGREEPEPKYVNESIKFIKKLEPKIEELKTLVKKNPFKLIEEKMDIKKDEKQGKIKI